MKYQKKSFKVIRLFVLILFVLSGCFNESKVKESEEEIMAKKFIIIIKEYHLQKSIKKVDLNLIVDGVYFENESRIAFYDMNYLIGLSDEEMNLLASKLYNTSSNFKKAYIVVSNRALKYQNILEYVGISDFIDNEKSCDIFGLITFDTKVWSVSENEFKKANGEKIIVKIKITFKNTGDIISFGNLGIFIFNFKVMDNDITKLTLQGDALVGENFSPSIINVDEIEFSKKIYIDLKSNKIKTEGIKFIIWKGENIIEEKIIFFN